MFTRQDYMADKCSHRQYYAQFVNEFIKQKIINVIGLKRILESKDDSFNDIPLLIWDNISLPYSINDLLKEAKDFWSLSANVCILKEASRQIRGF